MNKLLSLENIPETVSSLHDQQKKIVLVGGGFDILHRGHLTFLSKAKKQADILVVLLESDETIRKHKGDKRPVNIQAHRASVLAALPAVDFIVLLPHCLTDQEYDDIVLIVKPAIIATTKGDPGRRHKERQVGFLHAEVVDVTPRLSDFASSFLAEKITDL